VINKQTDPLGKKDGILEEGLGAMKRYLFTPKGSLFKNIFIAFIIYSIVAIF